MISKNFLLKFAAVSLFVTLLQSGSAFAREAKVYVDTGAPAQSSVYADAYTQHQGPEGGVYIKASYNAAYIGSVNITATGPNAATISVPTDTKYKISYLGGGAAVGYYYSDLRIEVEGVYNAVVNAADNMKDKFFGNYHYIAGMVSAYYDIPMNDMVMPYVGGGAGMAYFTTRNGLTAAADVNLYPIVLQGKVGAVFNTGTAFMPFAGYRLLYFMGKDFVSGADATKTTVSGTALIHNLEAGVMIPFAV